MTDKACFCVWVRIGETDSDVLNPAWPEFLSEIDLFVLFVCCESRRWAISLIKNAFLLSEMLDCLSAEDNDVIISGSVCLYERVVAGVVGLVSSVY